MNIINKIPAEIKEKPYIQNVTEAIKSIPIYQIDKPSYLTKIETSKDQREN